MATSPKLTLITDNQEDQQLIIEARQADERFRTMAKVEKFGWVRLGRESVNIIQKSLWQYLANEKGETFHSWESYVQDVFDAGRSTVFRGVQLIEALGCIEDKELAKIPVTNAMLLMHLSEKQRVAPEWITRAQTLSNKELYDLIFDSLEGAAKPEQKRKIVFTGVSKSLEKRVELALKVAGWLGEDDRPNNQLEQIVEDFMQSSWQDEKNLSARVPLSNEQAYQQKQRIEGRDQSKKKAGKAKK